MTFHGVYVPQLLYPCIYPRTGSFHVLAIMDSAAMNTGAHVSFQIIALSGCMARSELIVFMVIGLVEIVNGVII